MLAAILCTRGRVIPPPIEIPSGGGGIAWNDGYKPPTFHPFIHGPIFKPEIVEAVVDTVAEVVEAREIRNPEIDLAKAEKALRDRLKAGKRRWMKKYQELIALEYARLEQENEDAQIAMLLFEL